YYDFFLRIFGLPLLLVMGIGPLIAWRRSSVRALAKTLRWPILAALVTGAALIAAGAGSSRPGLIAYTFSAFVRATIVVEFVRGTRATGSVFQLIARNRRRYGGYIVHASIVLLAIGIAGASAYQTTREQKLAIGQSMTVAGHTVTFRGLERERTGLANETRAVLTLSGADSGTIRSGVNQYFTGDTSREVGIHTDWLRAEDTYIIFDQQQGKYVFFKVLIKPLVNLIWLAGFVFLAGSLVALWPDAREQRRLVARLALARGGRHWSLARSLQPPPSSSAPCRSFSAATTRPTRSARRPSAGWA